MTGTFTANGQTSAQIELEPGEAVVTSLTGTPSGQTYTVGLNALDGDGNVLSTLTTYSGDTTSSSVVNTSSAPVFVQLSMVSISVDGLSVAYTFSQQKASDVLQNFTDPEGNVVLSVTKAGISVGSTNINSADNLGNLSIAFSTVNSRLSHAGV